MRIIQLNSTYNFGSTGKLTRYLHENFLDSGHDSIVLYGRGKKIKFPDTYKIGNSFESFINLIMTRILNRHAEGNIMSTSITLKKIDQFKPDIILIHNIHGYYINYKSLINGIKKRNIPIVFLLHDSWLFSGSTAILDTGDIDWENLSNRQISQLGKKYPKHFFANKKSILRNINLKYRLLNDINFNFVAPSEWIKKNFQKSFLKQNKISVIHNGIDLSEFYPERHVKNSKKIILGVSMEWYEGKGLEYFIRMAKDLPEKYEIILVGIDKNLKRTLPGNIISYERTSSIAELRELYSKADIFINPTMIDNFPTVNIEAQACGTPVITFDTGGSAEIIQNGSGAYVEKGNYDELLKKITSWPYKNERIIEKCVTNSERFSKEYMAKQYLELFNKILENK
ncbi:glycosyltransferase [Globicatella sanguinis]